MYDEANNKLNYIVNIDSYKHLKATHFLLLAPRFTNCYKKCILLASK